MGLKILVVDDEQDIVEIIKDRLEAYDFTVVSARNGLEALRKHSMEKFDGIFLDIKMPEMGGIETLEEIRKRDKEIPVILITSSSSQEIAREAMDKGANAYILKPFEWDEVKAKIENIYNITL